MAARTKRTVVDKGWRDKIQTTKLMQRLSNHALGNLELSSTQIKACDILLKKVAPDLQSVALTDADGGKLVVELVSFNSNDDSDSKR